MTLLSSMCGFLWISDNSLTTKRSLIWSQHFKVWRNFFLIFHQQQFQFTHFPTVSLKKTLVVLYVSLEFVPGCFYLYLCVFVTVYRWFLCPWLVVVRDSELFGPSIISVSDQQCLVPPPSSDIPLTMRAFFTRLPQA